MQYTGSSLKYNSTSDGIIYETRFDYYTRCTYEFTFQYVKEEINSNEYKFLEGENQNYTINKDNELKFRIDAEYSLFGKVYIDNELVDANNYTSKEGSTIITFNKDYINNLSVGEHTLKVMFNDGEASTKFSVLKEEIENPSTKDNFERYVITGIVSIVGLIGCTLILKKKEEK